MPNFIRNLCFFILILILTACSTTRHGRTGDTGSLESLEALARVKGKTSHKQNMGKVREMALRETALSLGAQSGLAWRAKYIDEELTRHAREMDAIYDFNALVLPHNILPPVLLEGRNTFNLANMQSIRISDRTYKVAKQAHFITAPPNWRQYLWLDYKKPDLPNVTLLPKNKIEKAVWIECVKRGWKNGIEQANIILEENLARIKEDFNGMILYRKLLAMNIISPPYVSNTDLGVTGDSKEIHIDDRVLRITELPALNTHSNEWRAAVSKDENALEKFRNMEKLAKSAKIKITSHAWQPVIAPTP